ncbi:MAG: HAMP domain-containing histidine kinase [Clostridia bacterium]|nr:HAMP domain-containing histidine kinase [Clostridia bacterium]
MTDRATKRRKLSHQMLGIVAICLVSAFFLFLFLLYAGIGVVEEYCWSNNIILDEDQYYQLDNTMLSISLITSVVFFIILFLSLFGDRLAYIRTIIKGVDTLQKGEYGHRVPLQGNNELTQLAEAVNYLSETERSVKDKESKLNEEKEELIRTLSHDIRTPLTSILAYSELLSAKEECTPEECRAYVELVQKKAEQIKDLTDILLDGGHRTLEQFEDARLLMVQLADEFEQVLEETFSLSVNLSGCQPFSGSFDVGELRRIFDNLISNVQKYADPARAVELDVRTTENGLIIRQKNGVRAVDAPTESYRMGLSSIRRIAHNYDGSVEIESNGSTFEITITLLKF